MRREEQKRISPAARAVFVILLIFGVVFSSMLWMRYNEMQKENEKKRQEILEISDQIEQKQEELSSPFDDEYVRRIARRDLGYCMPGEVIYFNDLEE